MDIGQRTDNYEIARAKLRTGTKTEAMARLWDMAREALAMRATMGVVELSYATDLIPGVDRVELVATERTVTLRLKKVSWAQWAGKGELDVGERNLEYVLDEAWLLGVAG